MKGDTDPLLAIRIAFALVLVFLPVACGAPQPEPSDTATPPIAVEEPTSLPQTPTTSAEPSPSADQPDMVFHNGSVLTIETDQPHAQALAIRGETILAVGSDEDVLPLAGPQTQLIDLQGRALMPGFVDAHTHLFDNAGYYGADLDTVQNLAFMNGITTLADMFVTPALLEEMQALAQGGRLRVRTSLYQLYNTNCGDIVGDWYREHTPTRVPGEMLRIAGVKVFADGGSCNAPAVSFQYPNNVGQGDLYFTQEGMNGVVAAVHADGYQLAIHALGDRAIEQVQNAIAAALGGQPNIMRHRIDHNAVLRPDMMPRYGEIGIVAVIFGEYPICFESDARSQYTYVVPEEYQTWEWPWRELLDANPGLSVAWHGDDPPMPPFEPLTDLWGFVTRHSIAEDGSICEQPDWFEANAITAEEALRLMTMGSAYALFRDEEVGSLKPDKFADVIILSEDPLAVAPDAIRDIKVLMTMVGGGVEYCASGFEALCPSVGE